MPLVARRTYLFPHIHNRLLSAPSSSTCLPDCTEKLRTFIYSTQSEMAQPDKRKKITCLCSIMYWALNKDRTNGGKEWSWACNIGINACVCTYGWGIREFSATGWAYPEDLFCFKRRREKSDNNSVCHTLVLRHTSTHTQVRTMSELTYRWVYQYPWPNATPITNSTCSSEWS